MKRLHFSIKIMKTEPDVSEEEISRAMDFGNVLKLVNQKNLNQRKMYRFITISVLIFTIIGVVGFFHYFPSRPISNKKKEIPTGINKLTISDTTSLLIGKQGKQFIAKEVKQKTQKPTARKKIQDNFHSEKQIVTTSAFVAAEPLHGFPTLYNFINQELKYPVDALKDSIQGVVTIKFVVDERGEPGGFSILSPLSPACDQEALRVARKMQQWKPATLDGKPIASKMTIPFSFSMNKK